MTLCNSELTLFSYSTLAIPYLPFFGFIFLLHSIPNILRALFQVFKPLSPALCLSAWSRQTQSSPLVRIWQCWPVAIYRNRWNANCQNRIIKVPYFPTDVPSKSLSLYKYCLISVVWNLSTFKEGNIECLNVLFHGQNIKCQKIFTLQSGKAKHSRLSSCFSPFDRWFSSLIKCHWNFQEKESRRHQPYVCCR